MASFTAYPSNKLYIVVLLKIPDDTDPREFLLLDDTMGYTPAGILADSKLDTATAAHVSFSANLTYTGIPGIWFFYLPATTMTLTNLNSAFMTPVKNPVLIVTIPNASRQVSEGACLPFREAA